jgi:tetratricopeptide (TPR) repeat protein
VSRGGPDVKAIFTAALEHPAGPERQAYLAAACGGDAGLRRRIEELLAALAQASDVLGPPGTPAAEAPTAADESTAGLVPARRTDPEATEVHTPPTELSLMIGHGANPAPGEPGTTAPFDARGTGRNDDGLARGTVLRYFGDYQIRRELGRGGMGVVYEARQVSLNRPVALKMVRAGLLAGGDELRRFQNEAEAVALLDHPGIVPVYEVGEHEGQHYFSMKLVPGGSLVPLLPQYKDDPRAAARLVAEAAEAVAHAHARGVLHRDLKPANLLVDDEGHPHVTDFGLAKKVEADVEFTQSGAILGTPAFMSPEQATGRRGSITTATDVYGLGSVLYALLAGKAPFGGDSVVETLDAVRNSPPEPPTRFNAQVPRDLETVCLKCLEKDPRRRYPSAQALADDLRAWLESRPIAARRVGPAERAWLWCRRKPAVAALSAAVFLALVVGTATVIAVQRQANRALAAKNEDLTRALGREAKANADLAAASTRVGQRYELAVDAIATFHTGVSVDFLLKEDKFKVLRDRLLKSAGDFYGKLGALLGRETDLASRRGLAQANFELAELTGEVGRKEDALAAHRAVLSRREEVAADPEADVLARVDVGRSLTAVASQLDATGKAVEAGATFRKAEALLAGLSRSSPTALAALAACRTRMGIFLSETGQPTLALAAYRLALTDQEAQAAAPGASNEARRDLADTIFRIGLLLFDTGKPEDAAARYREALAIQQRLVDDNPDVADFRRTLSRIHQDMGIQLLAAGKPSEAEAEVREALRLRQKLVDDEPAVTEFRHRLAGSHNMLALVLVKSGKLAEAEAEHHQALTLRRKLAADNPAVAEFRHYLAGSHNNLAIVLAQTGRPAEAEAEYREAIVIQRKLAADNPVVTNLRSGLAGSHNNLGTVLAGTGKPAEAETEYREALAIFRKLADDSPDVTEFRRQLAGGHLNLGNLLAGTGKPAEAEADLRQALALFQKLADDNPKVPDYRRGLASALNTFHHVIGHHLGREDEARDVTIAALERLVKGDPTVTTHRTHLARWLQRRGLARRARGETAGAAADTRRALGLIEELPTRSGGDWFATACCRATLAGLAGRDGAGVSAAEGEAEADQAMALLRKAVGMGYADADAFRNDSALDPLREREDFRMLMMELAFPADPFAPAR